MGREQKIISFSCASKQEKWEPDWKSPPVFRSLYGNLPDSWLLWVIVFHLTEVETRDLWPRCPQSEIKSWDTKFGCNDWDLCFEVWHLWNKWKFRKRKVVNSFLLPQSTGVKSDLNDTNAQHNEMYKKNHCLLESESLGLCSADSRCKHLLP